MADNKLNPQSLFNNIPKEGFPPVDSWDPPFCGEMDICIHADGHWSYLNSPFTRMPLVKLFSKVLKKEGEQFFLVTPVEKVAIKVEAEPFIIVDYEYDVAINAEQDNRLALKTNLDEVIIVDKDHPLKVEQDQQGNPYPTVEVRSGLRALLNRNVFYDLVELADQKTTDNSDSPETHHVTECLIYSKGTAFCLGRF